MIQSLQKRKNKLLAHLEQEHSNQLQLNKLDKGKL
jgi:hypothetical protein